MFNRTSTIAISLALMLGTFARAQEAAPAKDSDPETQVTAYRLDFAVNEMLDGKKINARQYSMELNSSEGGSGDLKIGTRVPMELKQGELQYIDLGTNISARIQKHNKQPEGLWVRADISNLASPEGNNSRPVLRQFRIEGNTTWSLAVLGKPMVMGSVDDPDSKRAFQLEVTVTKLR